MLNNIDEKEVIEVNAKFSAKTHVKNVLMSNIIYIMLWVAFDIFFAYLMTKDSINTQYWFMIIPLCGLNLIRIWVFVLKLMKEITDQKDTGYILTDKAIYYFSDGKYKQLIRIDLNDIVAVEKSEYISDGFYVATITSTIHINNVKEVNTLFNALIENVNK